MSRRPFTAGLIERIPGAPEINTDVQRGDWATRQVEAIALDQYAGLVSVDFDPELVRRTRATACARRDWLSADAMEYPDELLEEVRDYKVDASLDATGRIPAWRSTWNRARDHLSMPSLRRRKSSRGRMYIMHERELLAREQVAEIEQHRAEPAPEYEDPEAKLVIAAALACQAALSPSPDKSVQAAELLFTDYAQVRLELVGIGSTALAGQAA